MLGLDTICVSHKTLAGDQKTGSSSHALMKFKAAFSEVGAGWLEKRFLPAFEKLSPARGVELVLLLTPSSVHLIHDAKANGGPEIHADFVVRTQAVSQATRLVRRVAA